MNHAKLGQLPSHIKYVRQGALIFTRFATASWDAKDWKTISAAKRYVRTALEGTGGPRSSVRTAQSLDLE